MYSKRIKIFIIICSFMLLVCVFRLAQMQLFPNSSVQVEIDKLKSVKGTSHQLISYRGKILDRQGRILAYDKPTFWLNIDYQLSQYWDPNVQESMRYIASTANDPESALQKTNEKIQDKVEEIKNIIIQCKSGFQVPQIQEEIENINKGIWELRRYLAWKRKSPDKPFEESVPDPNQRMFLTYKVDITEMYQSYSLFELETDDAVFTAQFEFMNIEGIEVISKGKRVYPYNSIAAQTIGWVGGIPKGTTIFQDDELMRYLPDESCGRDGIEYTCEPLLRGKRGNESSDIDQQLISRTNPEFGDDVVLTLDIELQQKIEKYMSSYKLDPGVGPGMAEVIIDAGTGDILVMASIPGYDNNRIRYEWDGLKDDRGKPLINRAINEYYPAGSVVKPIILIAGMESGKVTSDEVISCPLQKAPSNWPNCWIYRQGHSSHDIMWGNNNNARNALKGSCNIFFSRLADRLDSYVLQSWLYRFGFGHSILESPSAPDRPEWSRNMRQLAGTISSRDPIRPNIPLEDLPEIKSLDKKYFGIGQGNMRVTPLQAANAMAALARGGIYMNPGLFKELPNSSSTPLDISQHTLDTVYDGMYAVVNERDGTANKEFSPVLRTLANHDVKVFGKTGSTEAPENAWFSGFAQDSSGRRLAFAVVVEKGQHGASDAAPYIRESLQSCIEAGYIGK